MKASMGSILMAAALFGWQEPALTEPSDPTKPLQKGAAMRERFANYAQTNFIAEPVSALEALKKDGWDFFIKKTPEIFFTEDSIVTNKNQIK
ncbi:hypothetical protein [Rhodothalassium salexigens]|nr:hypothetical protein [Rhodothalassium salexigens]MBB4210138.1 hypothetical protein [Rhodothalassium salexigens DSM 2132]